MAQTDPSGDALAQACAEAIWRNDRASQALGMSLDRVAEGEATLSMPVAETMCNGFGICHGGFIFTLADSAFAFACNGRDRMTVAQHCSITYLAPVKAGERLTASAVERDIRGRSGLYDITVANRAGETVALFRGHSRTVQGSHLPAGDADGTREGETS